MKIYKLDGTWLPDSAIDCINETGNDVLEHCNGCFMKSFTKRIVVNSRIAGKDIELVDRESCPYYSKIIEFNILYRKLENEKKKILKARKILEEDIDYTGLM